MFTVVPKIKEIDKYEVWNVGIGDAFWVKV